MFTTAAASVRKTRKGRTATVQPSTNFISSNVNTDSATVLRLQRLRPFGLIGQRANLIAEMAWEVARG